MYQAFISQSGFLQTLPSSAFNFGTGDFTIMGMVQSTTGGTVVARQAGTAAGFLLVINLDSSVQFSTSDGSSVYQTVTGPTTILDGDCHCVAGIRSGAILSILVDGLLVSSTSSGTATPPVNVNNNLALTFGGQPPGQGPGSQFMGGIMNVSAWNAALKGDQIVKAAFARIMGDEANLQGYWTLDATGDDLSPNDNPASIVGPVAFRYCFSCVWTETANDYSFCRIANMPDPRAPSMTVTLKREMAVPAGAPALAFAIMADQDVPAFPAGTQVQLTDPAGNAYAQDQNTDTVFAITSGGQLWGLMVINPIAGAWRVTISAPASSAFHITFNTLPSINVVSTCRQALDPLFGEQAGRRMLASRSLGGFWDMVAGIAVAAVVGVVAAGAAVILAAATPVVAVAVGVGAFAIVAYSIAAAALPEIAQSNNLSVSTGQVTGMAGFVVAADKLLLMDANVAGDPATQIAYQWRSALLYPAVTASTFNKVQSQLLESQMKLVQVKPALESFDSGYVSGNGHGMAFYLTGWYVNGNDGPLQEVLGTSGPSQFTPAEAKGKIIHFFACNCGYMGTSSPGLGRALVAGGAVAFFGYNIPYSLVPRFAKAFCAPDIEIDLQMIAGKTCGEAYTAAIAKYDKTIRNLRNQGEDQAAALLEANRNALVSPSTDAAYGQVNAALNIK